MLAAATLSGQSAPATPLRLVAPDGTRPIPTVITGDTELVAFDDLAAIFGVIVREDTLARAITVSYKGKTIVVSQDQALASISGRLVSLPAPPARIGARWHVPVEFIGRALSAIYDVPLELRKASRLVLRGRIARPRVVVRHEVGGNQAPRHAGRGAAHAASGPAGRRAPDGALRCGPDRRDVARRPVAGLRPEPRRRADDAWSIELGPRFASFRAADSPLEPTPAAIVVDLFAAADQTATPGVPAPDAGARGLAGAAATPGVRTIVIDPGHGGDEDGAKGAKGTLEKALTLAVARRLKSGAGDAPRRPRAAHARRRPHAAARRARGVCEQQQGRRLRQPPRQRLAATTASRRAGLLSQPRSRGRGSPPRRRVRGRGDAGVRRRHARDRRDPLGDGAGAAHRPIGGTGQGPSKAASRGRADEPAADSAGAISRAGRRQHAGGARGDGLPHQRGAGIAAASAPFQARIAQAITEAVARFFAGRRRRLAGVQPQAEGRDDARRGWRHHRRRGASTAALAWLLFVGLQRWTRPAPPPEDPVVRRRQSPRRSPQRRTSRRSCSTLTDDGLRLKPEEQEVLFGARNGGAGAPDHRSAARAARRRRWYRRFRPGRR